MDSQINKRGQQYVIKEQTPTINSKQNNPKGGWEDVVYQDQGEKQNTEKEQQQRINSYVQPQQQFQQQNYQNQQQKQNFQNPPKFQQQQNNYQQPQSHQQGKGFKSQQVQNSQIQQIRTNTNRSNNQNQQNDRFTQKNKNESSSGERDEELVKQSQPNLNPEQRPSEIEQEGLNYLRKQKKRKQLKEKEDQEIKEQRRLEAAVHKKYLNKKSIEDCLRKQNPSEALIQHFKQYYPKSGQITFAIDNIKIEKFRNFIEFMHQMVYVLLVSANYIPYIEEIFNSSLYQTQLLAEYNYLIERIHYKNAYETNQIIKALVPFIKMCINFLTYSSNSLCCPLCTYDVQQIFQQIVKAKHHRLLIIEEEYEKFKQLFQNKLKIQEEKIKQRQYDETVINYDVCPAQPVSQELTQQKNIPYFGTIMKVLQSEPYASVESYLNNNFYILREDYMRDFRTAIFRLRESGFENLDRDVLQFVFIYSDLNLDDVKASNNGVIYTVSFIPYDIRRRRIDWAKNNRLMTGSLLAFTRADFSMFVFASVHYKNPQKIQDYYDKTGVVKIQIKLFGDKLIDCIQELNKLMMSQQEIFVIENKIYFETYIHYLRCIQQIDPLEFPLKEQLVYSKKGSPIPKYFGNAKSVMYGINLKYDLKQPTAYVFKNQIDILQPWNSSIKESLDDSQFKAIQLMVRSGLAIVQGPPGTGKTYCGALAIRILLNNQKQWNPDQQNELFFPDRNIYGREQGQVRTKNKPILVVCNTNHALDQFLSHILIFAKPEDVVRIGGRCKIDKIKQLGLKQVERARFDDENRYKYYKFKQIQKDVQRDVSNMLNSADNVAFADFVEFQGDLVDMIVNDFCLREDLSYFRPLNVETKRLIFYLWMDNKKPRDEHVDKIIKLEQKNKNLFIREVDLNKKQQWRGQMVYREPLNLQIGLSQEQIIRMLQSEYDGYDENENVNSDDENDRKMYDNHDIDPESKETQINQARQCLKRLGLDQQKLIKIQEKLNIGVSPWDLNSNERFVLITSVFVKRYDRVYEQAIEGIELYDELNKELQEKFIEEDLKLIQSKKIVGATVTGCAKYAQKFDQLNFSIMIIEEAAEVLESHTVAILKKSVEHLILIGDHLQLKPKLQSYYLEIKYQPNISLFERLVNNQVEYVTLTNQRRMKSKFADFIRLIYDNYQDHPDILNYQNKEEIQGLENDLMFFDHRVLENNDSSTNSKSNMFEASMIIKMVAYLIKNGTNPKDITILATYMKQALIIKRLVENEKLYGIRVQTIDNYQGEENEFVFLSLVRSNKTKSLGFVSVDNRVCVALSRARIGMFIFGNFKFICDTVQEKVKEGKGTDLWIRIIQLAQQKKVINDYIGLQCQSHKKKVEIRTIDDWRQVSGGGCNVDCNIKFDCGHVCKEKCHKFDHIRANCKQECDKILECGHKCKALCKKIDCPPCNWKVQKQLKCGHFQDVACAQKNAICQQKCLKIMVCGHKCQMLCSDPCDQKRCYEYKNFTIPKCGHTIQIKCSQITIDGIMCTKKCESFQPCGHQCNGTCGGCLEGTFHQPCDKKCSRILRCGHECDRNCGQPCNRCNKPCSYKCCVEKCRLKCGEVCQKCQNKCKYHCDHQRCKMKCYEDCDREPCDLECKLILECGCICSGLCGEKCPIICKAHNQEGYDLLFGNELNEDAKFYALECPSEHVFEVSMLDYYFKQRSEELEKRGGQLSYIRCPKCNLVISQSSRYQKYIKAVQKNLNEIKRIENKYMLINLDDIDDLRDKIKQLLIDNNNKDPESFLQHTQKFLDIQINKLNKGVSSEIIRHEYNCIKNQLDFYEYGIFILNTLLVENQEFNMHKKIILKEYLFNSDLFYRANDQFWERLALKLETMKIYIQLLIEYEDTSEDRLLPLIYAIEEESFILSQQQLEKFKSQLNIQEIREITKAVLDAGQGQGHWFKCPNGHFFAIGNCGGAMEVSKCVDCGAKIGGQQHKLLQDNQLASEIDGAKEDAYKRLQRQNGNI